MGTTQHDPSQIHSNSTQLPRINGSSVKIHDPRLFNGKHDEVVPFISEIQRIIKFHPASFPDDHKKVLFVVLYLKDGNPVEWFNHLELAQSSLLYNWTAFLAEFRKKFADPRLSSSADQRLDKLKQTGSAHSYFTRFVEISSHLNMTEQTKINQFMHGLNPAIKDNLVSIVDCPSTLMGWENIIIQVDANLYQRDKTNLNISRQKTPPNLMSHHPPLPFLPLPLLLTSSLWKSTPHVSLEENSLNKNVTTDLRIILWKIRSFSRCVFRT